MTSDFKESLVRACVIDLCETNTEETRHQIVSAYVSECKKDEDEDFLCDWETQFFGNEPTCEANEEYKGLTLICKIKDTKTFFRLCKQLRYPNV